MNENKSVTEATAAAVDALMSDFHMSIPSIMTKIEPVAEITLVRGERFCINYSNSKGKGTLASFDTEEKAIGYMFGTSLDGYELFLLRKGKLVHSPSENNFWNYEITQQAELQ